MRLLVRSLVALLALLGATAAPAADDAYQLNKQYVLVNEQSPPSDPKKITVQEFFWYGCPVCYGFEPYLNTWLKKKPDDVLFERVPNSLGRPEGELHQRAFYVAMALGVEDKVHAPLFEGLRNVERGDPALTTPQDIDALFVKYAGTQPGEFISMAQSFAIDGNLRRADQLAMSYGVTGTPTIVVDGRWLTDVGKAGGYDKLPKVMDFLIDKARKDRGLR
jgi:thiol:disulfide interchange protein DsbA